MTDMYSEPIRELRARLEHARAMMPVADEWMMNEEPDWHARWSSVRNELADLEAEWARVNAAA